MGGRNESPALDESETAGSEGFFHGTGEAGFVSRLAGSVGYRGGFCLRQRKLLRKEVCGTMQTTSHPSYSCIFSVRVLRSQG